MVEFPNRHPLYTRLWVCAILSLAPLAAQDSALWKIIGPGGGGAMFHPTVSPLDPSRVLAGCDMTGSYLTNDGGASWRMFNLRSPAGFFAFDPINPKTMYTYAGGLWRSPDEGHSWALLYPDPSQVKGLDMRGDHASVELQTSRPVQKLSALAIDPANSDFLYAASSELLRSTDGGDTWQTLRRLNGDAFRIWIDPRSPATDRTVLIATPHGIFIREAGRWLDRPPAATWLDVAGGFVSDARYPIFYAITPSAIQISTDAGATWRSSALPGIKAHFRAIAASERHGNAAYVSFEGESFGVARTRDSGQTWDLVWKDTKQTASPNLKDAWINERLGPDWSESPLGLGVSPTHPDICYATDLGRTVRTLDGGKTWQAVYSRGVSDHAFTTTGLNVTTAYGVHFDPFNSSRVFIDYTDISLFRSEDSGQSWISSSAGIPHRWLNTVYWTVFDPAVRGRVWAAASGTHDLPRPKMWRHTSTALYRGGVVISGDGGVTWRTSNTGMPETAVTHIVMDPKSPPSARVLYAAGFGRGVYKSTDGGKIWSPRNTGITQTEPFAWRLTLDSTGTLYLVVARRSEHGEIGGWRDGALYRSTDGADHWEKMQLPAGVNGPSGLCVDARDPTRLYLAAWRRAISGPDGGGGIWLSTDGGHAWRAVLSRDQHVYDVTQDVAQPERLYAAGFESSAWRSVDRGETWTRIPGFNFKWNHRVIIDPINNNSIYITTFGGSIWHGPGVGDPKSHEDIAKTSLSYPRE